MNSEAIKGRRRIFAERVAEGRTSTDAYLLAGYRPAKRETAHRAASRLYAQAEIRAYIQDLRRAGDELAREETTLTIAKKLAFLARLVLTSSATLREDDPLIQSHRTLKDGSISTRMPCKLKALKMHSELAGHFPPEPASQRPPTDPLQELFDQIRQGPASEAVPAAETQNRAIPRMRESRKRRNTDQLDRIGLWRPPSPQAASSPKDAGVPLRNQASSPCAKRDPAVAGRKAPQPIPVDQGYVHKMAGGTNNESQNHQSRDCGSKASLSEGVDLFDHVQPPTTQVPKANANPWPDLEFKPQHSTTNHPTLPHPPAPFAVASPPTIHLPDTPMTEPISSPESIACPGFPSGNTGLCAQPAPPLLTPATIPSLSYPTEPLTPVQVRRLEQAQLKQASSLNQAHSGSPLFPTTTIKRPSVVR